MVDMSVLSARTCVSAVVLVMVLALGIAIGILFPGIWPLAKAAPAVAEPPKAPAAAALSAKKIVEEWGQGLPSHPNRIERYTLTAPAGNGPGRMTMGSSKDDAPAATAVLIFRTGKKFEDAWKHYAKKCGQDEARESLPRKVPMNEEFLRAEIKHGKGSDEFMAVDFGGIGPDMLGGDPGMRESNFGYYTEGYVVHVAIEEVGEDRQVNDKNTVKVMIYAAVR
jgi:hypothetical protein